MKTIFITERPTQIITALAILGTLKTEGSVEIFIANKFDDAHNITQRLAEHFVGIRFRITESYESAFMMAKAELPEHLFIHWDVGFRTQIKLRNTGKTNKNHKISVFEEGIGTYRQDIYPKAKRFIFRTFGLPINIGGSKHVSDIYVYNSERYLKNATRRPKEVIQINSLSSTIKSLETKLVKVFSSESFIESICRKTDETCWIYLSNWDFQEKDLMTNLPETGTRILKLHPHCSVACTRTDILIAPKSLPAELLIEIASRLFVQVTVYHCNSSTPLYINNKNVLFVNIKHHP